MAIAAMIAHECALQTECWLRELVTIEWGRPNMRGDDGLVSDGQRGRLGRVGDGSLRGRGLRHRAGREAYHGDNQSTAAKYLKMIRLLIVALDAL